MKVVFVLGPTASGKSDLALSWAQKFGGAIINCDSIQVFKSLTVGSAKPSAEDFKKVPHYLFDFIPEGKETTAGEYSRDFFSVLNQINDQYPVVFVVGGTGFYFQAIEKGMYPIGAANPEILKQVEAEIQSPGGAHKLHQELVRLDPLAAAKISENDHYRLARAIEIIRTHGKSVSQIKSEFEKSRAPFPYPLLKIGLRVPKESLLPKVQARTQKMLERGLVAEVQDLLRRGLEDWSPLQSVGYKETVDFIKGGIPSESDLRDLIVQNTLRLAKKQRTWFQRDPEVIWITPEQDALAQEKIQELLRISER